MHLNSRWFRVPATKFKSPVARARGFLLFHDVTERALNFIPPAHPAREAIDGRYARLEPLDVDRHGDALWAAVQTADEIWRFMAYGPFLDRDAFDRRLADRASLVDPLTFAIVEQADRRARGLLSLMEIRPAAGVIELGHILFSPGLRKTRVATEAIYTAARHVFAAGYRRLEWKCDNRNEPSKEAARRYGFTAEGVFRQHMIVKRENRDTAWFSMLDGEWPRISAAFEAWLDPRNFTRNGAQIRRLADFRAV